jgi:hypothetical protein
MLHVGAPLPLPQEVPGRNEGPVPNGAAQTVRSKAETLGTKCKVLAGSILGRGPNEPLHVTAARLRICLNRTATSGRRPVIASVRPQ